jgi:hypothetical protein
MSKISLKKQFEKIVNLYIYEFEKQTGLQFDFWIGDEVGGVASFSEASYADLDDIRFMVDNKCTKYFTQYIDFICENNIRDLSISKYCNMRLKSEYIKGFKFDLKVFHNIIIEEIKNLEWVNKYKK